IGTELIKYVSTSPTQVLQCTRGAFGSPIPTLNYEGGTPVERCVYRKFEIVDIATENGTTVLTVDRDLDVEGDEIPIVVGTSNVAIIGNGTIQFGYSTMSLQVCIFGNVSNNWYVGDGIRLRSFNSAGCTASLSSDWF